MMTEELAVGTRATAVGDVWLEIAGPVADIITDGIETDVIPVGQVTACEASADDVEVTAGATAECPRTDADTGTMVGRLG